MTKKKSNLYSLFPRDEDKPTQETQDRIEFISPETLEGEARAYFETAKEYEQIYGSEEKMIAWYLRLAQLFEEKARNGGYYGVPESTLLVGVGDPILEKIAEEQRVETREQHKAMRRKYPHAVSTLLDWELRDLDWVLELKSMNILHDVVGVPSPEDPMTSVWITSSELIRRLQNSPNV